MKLLNYLKQLNHLPETSLKQHLLRYYDLFYEDGLGPLFVVVELSDQIAGLDYFFVGPKGLLSDLWEEHEPGHPEFCRMFEWVSYLPSLQLYESLLLINNEDGYLIFIPEAVVEANPDLKWVLTDESQGGLSPPQPQ